MLCEMQSVSSRIWTCIALSISYDDNHYSWGTSSFFFFFWLYVCVNERVCVFGSVDVSLWVYVCVCVCVYVCRGVNECVFVFTDDCMVMCLYISMWVWTRVWMFLSVHIFCDYIYAYVCLWTSVYVHTAAYVCVCKLSVLSIISFEFQQLPVERHSYCFQVVLELKELCANQICKWKAVGVNTLHPITSTRNAGRDNPPTDLC